MVVKGGKSPSMAGMLLLLISFISGLCADEYKVIRDPRPTVEEKNYIPLERVGTIREELGGDQYLFHATAGVVDGKGRLFLMDALQGKVLIFDARHKYIRSFGRHGVGPGEFMKNGRNAPVSMSIGLDGNLWINECLNLRISVFDTEGKFLRHVRLIKSPTMLLQADSRGKLLQDGYENGKLFFYYEPNETVFTLPHPEKAKEHLFYKPEDDRESLEIDRNMPFQYDVLELQYLLIDSRTLLMLFLESGDYILVRDGKIARRFRLWPRDLINFLKVQPRVDRRGHRILFYRMSSFCGKRERIFLETLYNKNGPKYFIYELTPQGDITAVYFRDRREEKTFLLAAGAEVFYFRNEDGVDIFKPHKI